MSMLPAGSLPAQGGGPAWPWLAAVALLLLALLLYWLLVTTEGVFLGRRVVVWLYDLVAHRYDRIKQFDPQDEREAIARPLLAALRGQPEPWLLDVATGAGRVPAALLAEPAFTGRVAALDASRRMLARAATTLAPYGGRVALLRQAAAPLPFDAGSFDAVTCLEALELFPSDAAALREMVRVLRPGGFLMTSRRRGLEARAYLGRYRSRPVFDALLRELGLVEIQFHLWEVDYDLVTARKPAAAV